MIERLRERLEPLIVTLGSTAAKTHLPPTAWSVIGIFFSLLSALAYAERQYSYGGLLLIASGLLDVVDGSVARVTGTVSRRGAFIDSTLDRLTEIFVFTGLVVGKIGEPAVIVLTLGLSLTVSYVRARGEAEGLHVAGVGVGERGDRILALAFFSLAGYPYYGVYAVLILAAVTVVQRVYFTFTSPMLRRS